MSEGVDKASLPCQSIDEILAKAVALRKSTSQVTSTLRHSVSQAQASLERVGNRREYIESLKEADRVRDVRASVLAGETQQKLADLDDRWEAVQKRLFQAGEKLFGVHLDKNDSCVAESGQTEADLEDNYSQIIISAEDIANCWLQLWLGREISIAPAFSDDPLPKSKFWRSLPDDEWRRFLSSHEYDILRQKDTEQPNSEAFFDFSRAKKGYLLGHEDHGALFSFPEEAKSPVTKEGRYYCCRGCQLPLFADHSRFESSCGWPAFAACYFSSASILSSKDSSVTSHVAVQADADGERFEIVCKRCLSHLGHVFCNERFAGSERHCVNSRCLETRSFPEIGKPVNKSLSCQKRALTSAPVFGKLRNFKSQHLCSLAQAGLA
eukprot:gnl/MRDRNA2_/MRDRNA2_57947_c0_seq1.p1 gnl/MRDRNA2_/MRDRNA2_57947_c0~~gnl/MRDRNA2_/MRDRNA2_57947_c0_seq1.p1  ORF type:complete len:381 (-),score=51.86 gnl/MRDRNA2_/MRDRNA2_57947_c0_seq1:149-1291(-)